MTDEPRDTPVRIIEAPGDGLMITNLTDEELQERIQKSMLAALVASPSYSPGRSEGVESSTSRQDGDAVRAVARILRERP